MHNKSTHAALAVLCLFAYGCSDAAGRLDKIPNQAPKSNASLQVASYQKNSFVLTWYQAEDEATPSAQLLYQVVVNSEDDGPYDLSSLESALAHGIPNSGWIAGLQSWEVKNVKSAQIYHINVLVKDQYGLVSHYGEILHIQPAAGVADSSFGNSAPDSNGNPSGLFIDAANTGAGYGIVPGPNGKAFVAGRLDPVSQPAAVSANAIMLRLNAYGQLDVTGPDQAYYVLDSGLADAAYDIQIDMQGRLTVGGVYGANFGLWRYSSDGVLQASFAEQGIFTVSIPPDVVIDPPRVIALAIDSQNRIVLARTSVANNTSQIYVGRLSETGDIDQAFLQNDPLSVDDPALLDRQSVAVDALGNIYLASFVAENKGQANAQQVAHVWKFRAADGLPDERFDSDGLVKIYQTQGDAQAFCLALDGRGKVVVFGTIRYINNAGQAVEKPGLWRVDSTTGALDTEVTKNALATQTRPFKEGSALAIDQHGGYLITGESAGDMVVVRIHPDGTPDMDFGVDGAYMYENDVSIVSRGNHVGVDRQGRIVVVGQYDNHVAVWRLN